MHALSQKGALTPNMKTRPASAFLDGPGGGGRWRRALLALALGCAACAASEKGSGTAAAEQEKIKLPEAEEKALREVVDKLVELKRQRYTEAMQAVLDDLAEAPSGDA